MNKTRNFLIALCVVAVVLVGIVVASFDWEYVENEVGLSSEAQENPLLAAQLFLQTKGKQLQRYDDATDLIYNNKVNLPENEVLIIDEGILAELDYGTTEVISQWIESGGHLVYLPSARRDILALDNNQLLSWAGISIIDSEEYAFRSFVTEEFEANAAINTDYGQFNVRIYAPYVFQDCAGEEITQLETEQVLICDLSYGEGFLTFIPSLDAISNNGLRQLDHGEYLLWLTGTRDKINYLPSLKSFNWFSLIWQKSTAVIVLTGAVLLMLLWHFGMRLGLPMSPIESEKNLFAEHLSATGSFLNRHGYHQQMHQALVQDIDQQMEKRNPKYKSLPVSEQAKLLSQLTGKNEQHIQALLSQELPKEADARVQHIKWFKELRNLL